MFRGVITSPAVLVPIPGGGFESRGSLNLTDLNYYSLYWDRLVVPDNHVVRYRLPLEEHYIGEGILVRPMVDVDNSDELIRKTSEKQIELLKLYREEKRTDDWFIHDMGQETALIKVYDESKKSLRIKLINALPVPSDDVPLVDVLEFKRRHSSALSDLHNYLDEVYKQVLYCPDDPLFEAKAYSKMEAVIKAINQLSQKRWGEGLLGYSLTLDFSSTRDVVQTIISTARAFTSGEPSQAVLDLGQAALSFVRIKSYDEYIPELGGDGRNLMFLADAFKERILAPI
ncbi:DUF6236 family protein [Pantoea sp. Fr+CA_20]|uniref:DUF6236 family protein n=1 Tax=Pantoea sp. Fr+CA_20 TaxID=2929506 RepID=UPI0021187A1F|nr:DUF6236 family protein [Pantoea sp. Fr+CA_20]